MIDDANSVLGIFGLKFVNAFVAAIVSFCTLRFWDDLTTFHKWTTFFGGWALAAWGAGPLTAYFKLSPAVEIGFVILIALFGFAASSKLITFIKTADWLGIGTAILNAFLNRKSGGS